jgi:hypothetical protein
MVLTRSLRGLAIATAATALAAIWLPASAQEISADHLKSARAAVAAINATEAFDGILPSAAAVLKQSLIQKNPDLQEVIVKTVDEKTLALASRRADLEKESALAYARVFSKEDLDAMAAFYESPAGKKLLSDGPIVVRELDKAADIWQRGVARDLAEEVGKALEEYAKQHPVAPVAPATTEAAPKAN